MPSSSRSKALLIHVGIVDTTGLNKWAVAAHNASVRLQHRCAVDHWARLAEPGPSGSSPDLGVGSWTEHKVGAAYLPPGAAVFSWPPDSTDNWLIICTDPDCAVGAFTKQPLLRGRALDHFLSHGLDLASDLHVLQLFGFRGSYYHPIRSPQTLT